MVNTKQAAKWVKMAREEARRQMGTTASLLTLEVRRALACQALVGIIAGQDESCRDGDTMAEACTLILTDEA